MKYTKMVCTIGPASESPDMLVHLIKTGMDVARLNFSHNTHDWHKGLIKKVRKAGKSAGKTVAVLQDLQGPKIRMGVLSKPFKAVIGKPVILGKGGLPVQVDLSKFVGVGQTVLIDDGFIELRVEKVTPEALYCICVHGGQIISNKGINVPESNTNFSVFTDKDRADLAFGLKNGVDLVAMSFVRTADDILEVKEFIRKELKGTKRAAPWVIAKIEKPQAIKNIDAIIEVSDGIMVARGDLGIEAEQERVPLYQKLIVHKCRVARKPVIVATQMLDSMMRSPRPTRAEVSDVANAVLDHADATMLSGESAYGQYPSESVATMAKTIAVTEQSYFDYVPLKRNFHVSSPLFNIVHHAKKNKEIMVVYSPTGEIARNISNLRQDIRIFAYAPEEVANHLVLDWGINPFPMPKGATQKSMAKAMIQDLASRSLVKNECCPAVIISKMVKGKETLDSAKIIEARELKKMLGNVKIKGN